MPMDEEDYEVLRAEAGASRQAYDDWDANHQFAQQYAQLHEADPNYSQPSRTARTVSEGAAAPTENIEKVETRASSLSSSASSSSSSSSSIRQASAAGLSEIQTLKSTPESNGRGPSLLHRHPTERHPNALERIETQRSQHAQTVGTASVASRLVSTITRRRTARPLPLMGASKPYPPNLPEREEYVVEYEGPDDPLHPQNWPINKKLYIGAMLAFDAITSTMASSIFSAALMPVARQYGVSAEVSTLGTSFFVLGFAFGPLLWAPLSELYGRKQPLIVAAFGFSIFSFGVAAGKDLQTILICRFFSGIFGSAPLALVAAVFADIFNNTQRGLAVAVFATCVFMGPFLAPFIGGFITSSYLGWRWTEYLMGIMGIASFLLLLFFMEESYPPVVLVSKASELRRRTKNWGIHAKQEEIEVDFKELIVRNVSRPLRMLFTEPIILLVTIYMSFIYGILYLFLTAYALVFQGKYGFNPGLAGLTYFGMVIGEVIAFIVIVFENPRYAKKLAANNNIPVPEWRLPIAMVGGILFTGGLFWFGWTGYSGNIHWIVPTLSGLFTGFGIFSIFLSLLNYIVDSYLMFAASAIAANTLMRSTFGAIFPLFATYMFNGMGIQWASTLLGCIALICVPMPFLFYKYGRSIRGKSTFAPAPDIAQDKRRDEEARGQTEGSSFGMEEEKEDQKKKKKQTEVAA